VIGLLIAMIWPTCKVDAGTSRVRNTSPGLAVGCIEPVSIGENPNPNCDVKIAGSIATSRAREIKEARRTFWTRVLLLLIPVKIEVEPHEKFTLCSNKVNNPLISKVSIDLKVEATYP
jgi:hypothetical protein